MKAIFDPLVLKNVMLATPAEIFENGTDYVPTDRRVLFGHHFAPITSSIS